ncbi:MAG: glycyl-radical enzyme activating protein [Candidatus Aminicenantales bacterium]
MVRKEKAVPRESVKGFIFDIKRFAVHDGPGIRTTIFFKGCPLHCLWCHNPESIDRGPELIVRSARCSRCYACLKVCPKKAISAGPGNGPVVVDRSLCDLCGQCVEACAYEALAMVGRRATVGELVEEASRDAIFYEQSGGGVTLSGGEPLAQPVFAIALLGELKARGFQTALDTSGLAKEEVLAEAVKFSDLILYDLKLMDAAAHRRYTHARNENILENLRRLDHYGKPVRIRIPLVAGVNDGEENIAASIGFLKTLSSVQGVDLLKYHRGGQEKYKNLDTQACFQIFEPPSEQRSEAIRRAFAEAGFNVTFGG